CPSSPLFLISITLSSPLSTYFSTLSLFFFNDTATTEIYTLSLHDALPICRFHPKIAKDINRFDFSMDPHRIGYQCQLVISGPDCAGQIEYGKGLIQPPLSRNGRQGLPVQAHFPYMGTFHHGLETIQIDAVIYLKMIRCCKAGPCLEGITVQDICFELHGCIPRIPVCKAMEFEYRICRMVYMQIPEQTCSQLDVAEVNRQDIRTEPLHLGGSGSDFPEIGRLWHMIRETRPLLPADKK